MKQIVLIVIDSKFKKIYHIVFREILEIIDLH